MGQWLTNWQEGLDDYGVDEAFSGAAAAARDGGDYPPLKRVLAGTITEHGRKYKLVPMLKALL